MVEEINTYWEKINTYWEKYVTMGEEIDRNWEKSMQGSQTT